MQSKRSQRTGNNFDDDDDQDEATPPQVDPHSHQEILKHYLKQLRVKAPESFDRIHEDQIEVDQHQHQLQGPAQDFPESNIEGTFPSSVTASQFQALNNNQAISSAHYIITDASGNNINTIPPQSSLNMDSLRSPWLSQQKSSMPKSSFCLSMSLSEGSTSQHPKWRSGKEAVPELDPHQIPLSNNDSEVSQDRLEIIGASEDDGDGEESKRIVSSPSPRILIHQSNVDHSVDDDYIGDDIVRGGILLTENDSGLYDNDAQQMMRERPCHGVTGDTDDDDGTYNERRSSPTIERSQENRSTSLAQMMYQGACQSEVMIGEHLLGKSLNKQERNQFVTEQAYLLPSAPHTQDEGQMLDNFTPQKQQMTSPMMSSEQNESSQSQRIAQIRSMIEENAKVQQSTQGRLLKRQTTQLPTNSSMLLASAASQSASSPASGGHNRMGGDFPKRRNLESVECISQRQLLHALGSTSTIDILKRDGINRATTSTQSLHIDKGEENKEEGGQSAENRLTRRNNFLLKGSNKQSRLDIASSCSFMLSRSGASTVKEMIKNQLKSSTSRQFRRDLSGSIPQILGSFTSTANQACTTSQGGQNLVTTSSFTGKDRQNTQSRGPDSQASGHGSILQVFITEGVEEDTIQEDYCKQVAHADAINSKDCDGVSPSKQSSFTRHLQRDNHPAGGVGGVLPLSEANRLNQHQTGVIQHGIRLSKEEQELLEKQLMSNSQSLNKEQTMTAVVATGGSCTPENSKNDDESLQNSTPLQVLLSKIKPASTEKIYVDQANKEIVLQLEALQSDESGRMRRRKMVTPDCCLMFGNDEIQRVVSQVRKMEEESGEGTANKFAFEIERTDSLEFTRNSESGSQVSYEDGLQKKTAKTIKENDLDRTHTEQNNFMKSKLQRPSLWDDSEEAAAHGGPVYTVKSISQMQQSQQNANQQQLLPLESDNLLFHSHHSLTSENESAAVALLLHQKSELNSSEQTQEGEDDLNERSATSSQYNSEQVLMEASQTVAKFGQTNTVTEAALTTEPRGSSMYPFELPHASSKVFDEGEMPIPARFQRLRSNRTLLKTSGSNQKKPLVNKIVPEVSSQSQSEQSAVPDNDLERSRVKDHVQRFIRQSQDLGSTLGLIKEKISEPHQMVYSSVKQSMIGKAHPLSPQRVLSTRQWSMQRSIEQQPNINGDFLAALDQPNHGGIGGFSSSGVDNNSMPEYEIISGYQYPNAFSHPQTSSGSQIHQLPLPLQQEESAKTYKESKLNMIGGKNNGKNAMNYNELISSELSLNQLEEEPYYAHMPQKSIAFVSPTPLEVDIPSEAAYLKYTQENKHRMKAGSTFEQVVREFNRQNYFHQLQSPRGDNNIRQISDETESDNYGQIRRHESISSQQTDGQCNYFKQSSMTRQNKIQILQDDAAADSDSAAEYDCADEDMDGSQSVYPTDKVLEQNRARVLSMHFTKPTIEVGKQKKLKVQEERPVPTLKKLLFAQQKLSQPLNSTRNSKIPFQQQAVPHQQPRSLSQTKIGNLFKGHTYQTVKKHQQRQQQRANTVRHSFAPSADQNSTVPYRPNNASSSLIQTASPSSEYQMHRTTSNVQQTRKQQLMQSSDEDLKTGRRNQQSMPTIEENLISIDNQQLLDANAHTMMTEELKLPVQFAVDDDADSKHQTTNGRLFNKSIVPSSIQKDQSGFRQIQSMSHLLSSAPPAEIHSYPDEDQYYMVPYSSSHQKKKQFNRTVLSLNSSRQPTTKHQLESNFLQRSQSNGSAATSKPRVQQIGSTTEFGTQKRNSEHKYFCDNNQMTGRNHGTGQLNFGKHTPKTPKPTEMKRFPRVYIQNPVTSETAEQINEIDLVGRGFTDSQQLSLDSEMQHMFGMTRQNFQPHQSARPDAPTPQHMMYATETQFPKQSCTSHSNLKQSKTDRDSILDCTESRSSPQGCANGQNQAYEKRCFATQQRPSLTQPVSTVHHSSHISQQSSSANCRNCSLEQRKRSITQSAFQKAIKMTQYLMSEIERLQKNNQETAASVVVANEEQLEEMLRANFASQQDEE